MKKRGLHLTLEQADAHQRKHGFKPLLECDHQWTDYGTLQSGDRPKLEIEACVRCGVQRKKQLDTKPFKLRGKIREMNKTEHEFSLILEAQKRHGDIVDWRYQGIRLGWGDCMVYKPDFSVRRVCGLLPKLIEIKGAHIHYHQQAVARFKGCRAEWKEWFEFELWQRDASKQWNRLL